MGMLKSLMFKEDEQSFVDLMQFARYKDFDAGIVECKAGEYMVGWKYTGIDYESASQSVLNYLSLRLNGIFHGLETGWAMWMEALRLETDAYPDPADCHFPDPVSRMIDDERRKAVQEQTAHYETSGFIVLMYKPPSRATRRLAELMLEDDVDVERLSIEERSYAHFLAQINRFEGAFGDQFPLVRLQSYEDEVGHVYCNFARLLHYCATGIMRPVRVPDPAVTLDCLIAGQDFYTSFTPRVGDHFVGIVSIEGLQSADTTPAMLGQFDDFPLRYRWSTRFLFQNRQTSLERLDGYRRKWQQKVTSFKDQITQNPNPRINLDASRMVMDADEAFADISSGEINQGFYTSVFVLYSRDRDELDAALEFFRNRLDADGFGARIERVNATAAFLGSIPGNAYTNITKMPISTANLADLVPIASAWPGEQYAPCPLYPPKSPPLIQAETRGSTPFRVNLHVDDVGHTFIAGPTGSGKSTKLAVIIAQFLKYRNAQTFHFDKGLSGFAITRGVGGNHFELGADEDAEGQAPHLMPFRDIDTPSQQQWAIGWATNLLELQNVTITPPVRTAVHAAMKRLRVAAPEHRTITEFVNNVQDVELREALQFYTVDGPAGSILDGATDGTPFARVNCFELGELMEFGEEIVLPVILYLFRQIERALTGAPTLLVLDEVWLFFEHAVFRERIRAWLKTLRKANCAVVMATQSLSDAERSGIIDVILESCATKILLPHPTIAEETHRRFYEKTLGLNDREITLLATGEPKRQYFYKSVLGSRLFELNLRPKTLAFVGTNSPEDVAELKATMTEFPDDWRERWVEQRTA